MLFKNRRSIIFITMSILIIVTFSSYSNINKNINIEPNNTDIKSAQIGTHTIEISTPNIFWFECQIKIITHSNQTGLFNIFIDDISSLDNFNGIIKSLNLIENITQTFIINIQPKLLVFPGQYQFSLNISGLFTVNRSFESILGLGYITGLLLLGLFSIPLIYIIIKKLKFSNEISSPEKSISTEKQYEKVEGLPAKKIMCSNCQEIIPEGLSICPECGERIPEFLRYSNPSY
ncbi:MAG: zinc ribbon domain-containing protein [Candidatus Lokiarchaeota archaeon]|nr:zinc ribbon domain-containing protein [Candidatus Lokiarchaeota archaeon]